MKTSRETYPEWSEGFGNDVTFDAVKNEKKSTGGQGATYASARIGSWRFTVDRFFTRSRVFRSRRASGRAKANAPSNAGRHCFA
jgi:hypothetical protein